MSIIKAGRYLGIQSFLGGPRDTTWGTQGVCYKINTAPTSYNRRRQWHPIPVLLPGKSHGRRSLVGCSPWGGRGVTEGRTRLSDFTFTFHFHALDQLQWFEIWQYSRVAKDSFHCLTDYMGSKFGSFSRCMTINKLFFLSDWSFWFYIWKMGMESTSCSFEN